MSTFESQLSFLRQNSLYADRWLSAKPEWLAWLRESAALEISTDRIDDLLSGAANLARNELATEAEFMVALRMARQRMMLWIGLRDLNGLASLTEVTHALSYFAERTIAISIHFIQVDLHKRFGLPWGKLTNQFLPLMVVGMGKLGGKELNLSSDIDLIFLYEEEGDTQGGEISLSNHEWFTRMGKRLIKILSVNDEGGFVFRVDMRLRPNGDSGPLVCSLEMLEEYLLVQGREWERYAWIKGRLVFPSIEFSEFTRCEKSLDQLIRPFVYRRHLDYGVVAAIRELHSQIQAEAFKRTGNHSGRSVDIKLGRGGIREIEFLAQMFQLIRGGPNPRLRLRPTLQVLELLKQIHLLPPEEVDQLSEAYQFLRRLEHRIQIWEDQQTHYLPESESAQLRLAEAMAGPGLQTSRELFINELSRHQNQVANLFEKAFVLDQSARLEMGEDVFNWTPDSNLFPKTAARWGAWLNSGRQKALPEKSRQTIFGLIKKASKDLVSCPASEADLTLVRFLDLLEAIARRGAYLSILSEYANALKNVLDLLRASQWGAYYLIRHPHLLDDLLSAQTEADLIQNPTEYWKTVKTELDLRLDDALADDASPDHAMDILRVTHHTETFITLLADLGIGVQHRLSVEKVSDRLSALADLIVEASFERVWPGVAKKINRNPNFSEIPFAVISYGKLGGKELGYASDLDLVFLYDAAANDLAAQEIYSLLAKRMINWLTTLTPAGNLFEIDTRLRPNGLAGFLVTSVDAFRKYQLREGDNAAWVWEHQALTRARFTAGNAQIGERFEQIRAEVISQERDPNALRQDILEMRRKVYLGHPNNSNQFDLKHDLGGMVDIEFMVQFLVLAYSRKYPDLLANVGNIALLMIAAQHCLIAKDQAEAVANAYRLFRSHQHRLRLEGADKTRIDLSEYLDIHEAKLQVSHLWLEIFGEFASIAS